MEAVVLNGVWPRGLRHGAKDVGPTDVGRCLAPPGSVGQRAFAHSLHAVQRSREAWASWWALLLLKKEPMVLGELIEFGPCVSAEKVKSMCLDRSAHDG